MKRPKIIRSDGTQEPFEGPFSLRKMQEAVGGLIEIVYLDRKKVMIVNEEGRIKDLPVNEIASGIFTKNMGFYQSIHGDVILALKEDLD